MKRFAVLCALALACALVFVACEEEEAAGPVVVVEQVEKYKPDLPPDFQLEKGQVLYRGAGCRKCRNTGYRGRTGLFELMVVGESIREKIMARASTNKILTTATQGGMRLLRQDGWMKVRQGITTIDEVIRSTKI